MRSNQQGLARLNVWHNGVVPVGQNPLQGEFEALQIGARRPCGRRREKGAGRTLQAAAYVCIKSPQPWHRTHLGGRQLVRGDVDSPRELAGVVLVVSRSLGRRDIVGAAPDLDLKGVMRGIEKSCLRRSSSQEADETHLLLAVLLHRLNLVEAGERTVHALVEAEILLHGNVHLRG